MRKAMANNHKSIAKNYSKKVAKKAGLTVALDVVNPGTTAVIGSVRKKFHSNNKSNSKSKSKSKTLKIKIQLKNHCKMAKNNVCLIVIDGWGLSDIIDGNAIANADTPVMDSLKTNLNQYVTLDASGLAVGLPAGLMGNSEVGHLNIGAGRVMYQDIVRINLDVQNNVRIFILENNFQCFIFFLLFNRKFNKMKTLSMLVNEPNHSMADYYCVVLLVMAASMHISTICLLYLKLPKLFKYQKHLYIFSPMVEIQVQHLVLPMFNLFLIKFPN